MTTTIWKYPLKTEDLQDVAIPSPAQILSVGLDPAGDLCIWALVDPKSKVIETRTVAVFGTGNVCMNNPLVMEFLGTVRQGPFMWHVFIR